MKNINVRVEYIYNSGFTLETEDRFLVFDYYKGDLNLPDKDITFFVTHGHSDHYNEEIFKYKGRASYVISDDVLNINEAENIVLVHEGDELEFNGLDIRVFGSTDDGSSFYVNMDGIKIFHSGDLNWWAWEDSTEERELEREKEYKSQIDRLKDIKDLDIAFVPVDPRLEKNYYLAGEYFIETLGPKYFFPMHFSENTSYNDRFLNKVKEYKTKVFSIKKRNEKFDLQV